MMMEDNGDANGKYAKRKIEERWLVFIEKFAKLEVAVQRLTEHEKLDKPKFERWIEDIRRDITELRKSLPPELESRLRELEGRFSIDEVKLEERFQKLELKPEVSEKTDTRIKWLERIAWAVGGGAVGVGLLVAVFEFLSKWAKTIYLG